MATITITSPNVTKSFSLDAAQVTRLLDYAGYALGPDATNLEKEEWVVRRFFVLMRDDLKTHEDQQGYKTVRETNAKLPVTEV